MNINKNKSEKYSINEENSEERNDSNFEREGDYIINKMPKYKYDIKIIHPSPSRIRKTKTPDKIMSSSRFTIVSEHNNSMKNKKKLYIKNNIKHLHKNENSKAYTTITFYPGESNCKRNNSAFEKSLKYSRKYKKYKNKKYKNYIISLENDNNIYNNSNYDYIIDIFPPDKCICQEGINRIINEYFHHQGNVYYNKCNCGHNINYIKNYSKKIPKNINDYYNINSPKKNIFFRQPIIIENPIKNLNIPIQENSQENNNKIKNDDYFYNNNLKNQNKKLNKNYKYNNNIYLETSNFSNKKNSKKLKKIKISKVDNNSNNINVSQNYSFISADNSKNKISSPIKNNSFINPKRYTRKNYLSPYITKSNILSNNLNTTSKSNGRKKSNIIINKSSECYEKIKVIPLGQKIEPLLVKKSVEKPIKEKIVNKDGTITNVIRQTSVITSIESKPVNQENNSNNKNFVKEQVTKIYTTLTKNESEIDENNIIINDKIDDNSNNKKNNNLLEEKNLEKNELENFNIDNYNKQNNINNIEINDLLVHKNNNNSSFNYSSLYSNIYDPSEQNNNEKRINDIVKYVKYLYYRYNNLTSFEDAKEESLANYFLKLSEEEKLGVLNNLNDGNLENKNIYNKLKSILEENYIELISGGEEDKDYNKFNQGNILFKKKKIIK